jgi:hypothetical protein
MYWTKLTFLFLWFSPTKMLDTLPNELILEIASKYLTNEDLLSLRAVSRRYYWLCADVLCRRQAIPYRRQFRGLSYFDPFGDLYTWESNVASHARVPADADTAYTYLVLTQRHRRIQEEIQQQKAELQQLETQQSQIFRWKETVERTISIQMRQKALQQVAPTLRVINGRVLNPLTGRAVLLCNGDIHKMEDDGWVVIDRSALYPR